MATSVGPGIVLTTALRREVCTDGTRPAEGRDQDAGRRRVRDIGDGGRDDEHRQLRRGEGRQCRSDRVVVHDPRQDPDEHDECDCDQQQDPCDDLAPARPRRACWPRVLTSRLPRRPLLHDAARRRNKQEAGPGRRPGPASRSPLDECCRLLVRSDAGVDGVEDRHTSVLDCPVGVVDRGVGVRFGPIGVGLGEVRVDLIGAVLRLGLERVETGLRVGTRLLPR